MKLFALITCLLCAAVPCVAQTFTLDAVTNCPGLGYGHDVVLLSQTYYIQWVSGAWSPLSDDSQQGGLTWEAKVTYYDYGNGQTGVIGATTPPGFYATAVDAEAAALGIYPIQGHGGVVSFYLEEPGYTPEVCTDNRGSVTLQFITPTGAGDIPRVTTLEVRANYPNPFTGSTAFDINVPRNEDVTVQIFDAAGRRVHIARLANQLAGWHTVSFDGRDDTGRALASGIYFAKVSAAGQTVTRKMVLVR